MHRLVRDLNRLYRATPALYQRDFDPSGFEWIDHDDAQHAVLSFVRRGADAGSLVVVVCNFTPVVQHGWRIGVPQPGALPRAAEHRFRALRRQQRRHPAMAS